ncbi:MAG: MiaB/RimO family radical SAM methylthiotransferase [Verrucomicrobia bacterium]|nr:MiaB/RimO family radical SAM methylthiotransferase [Verrucomicrobiota bacterium]
MGTLNEDAGLRGRRPDLGSRTSAIEPSPSSPDPLPSRPSTYAVRVLGCKVNQYEAAQIGRILELRNLVPAAEGDAADVTVVHTCAVTAAALRNSKHLLRRERAQGAGIVIATGCAGARDLLGTGLHPDAIVAAGPRWVEDLAGALDRILPATGLRIPVAAGGPAVERFRGHTRAFLKIQDGCDLGCSYCIVPLRRGAPRDRPLAAVVDEARAMVRAGHSEIVVTGVSVGLWGRDRGGLAPALAALARIDGLRRIRLSSLHPAELSDALLDTLASSPKFMPHVHLPLQSGSDAVLGRMNRGYDRAAFLAALARARKALNRPAFTSDVIPGFPGESERDFEDTLAACREAAFSSIHVFPFSARPGTAAADLPGRIPSEVVTARANRLRDLAEELRYMAHRRFLGDMTEVLCETRDRDGSWQGYDPRYIPVRLCGPPGWRGRIVSARLDALDGPLVRATVAG